MLMKCPNCGKDTSNKAKFCISCGYAIATKKYECKECGAKSVKKYSVCPNCGYKTTFLNRNIKIIIPISICVLLVIAIAVVSFLRFYSLGITYMPSGSMEPKIESGDRVKYDTWHYKFRDPERFDVIMFEWPDDRDKTLIKRVIGLPGETITLKNGFVYIDNEEYPLDEPYINEKPNGMGDGVYKVPEGCYFVLGDNRNYSKDSRLWENKYVEEDMILGKVKVD